MGIQKKKEKLDSQKSKKSRHTKILKMKLFTLTCALSPLALASPLEITKNENLANAEPYPKFEIPPRYPGACPDLQGTSKWNPEIYTSHNWWQPISSPFFWNFPGTTCISATYVPTGQTTSTGGVYFSVTNQGILPMQKQEKYGEQYEVANGQAVQNTAYNGTASVIFYDGTPNPTGANYIILDTDNESYAYVWSPAVAGDECKPLLWMLFADRNLKENDLEYHVEQVTEIIEGSGWAYASQFLATLEYWPSFDCPDVPNSPYD